MDLIERSALDVRPHPWEEARSRFFLELLSRHHALSASTRVLDVGAGDGFFSRRLLERAPGAEVFAWDSAYTDDDVGALSTGGLVATRSRPAGAFDLVLLLDVLEHVDDDRALLETARQVLAPGGRVLVSVPAWPRLFGSHDMRLRHRRRYEPSEARALLEESGLVLVESGGLFHSLLLPRAVSVAVDARLGRGQLAAPAGALARWEGPSRSMAATLLCLDNSLSRAFARGGFDVPGLSWWALCARGAP
jgi:SAM-dependent methyltransferase